MIITHRSPDMDALVSVYIMIREQKLTLSDVLFRSSYDECIPDATYVDMTPQTLSDPLPKIIDHHYGNNNPLVAAELVWRMYGSKHQYRLLVEEAAIHDRCQDRRKLGVRFRDVFVGVKAGMMDFGKYSDVRFAAFMFNLFDDVVQKELKHLGAEDKVKNLNVRYVDEGNYLIAFYEGKATPYVGHHLFGKKGVSFIVYRYYNNTGITRNADLNKPSLVDFKSHIDKVVKEQADEWYYHPDGFLASRGTHSSPARSVPNIELTTLVNLLTLFLRGG